MLGSTLRCLGTYAVLSLAAGAARSAAADVGDVTVGVLAYRGTETAIRMWTPTVDYLSDTVTGHRFRLLPLSLEEVAAALDQDRLDFVFTNPGHYVELEAGFGITRIATLVNVRYGKPTKSFGAVIFTRAGRADIRRLSDLRGKVFEAVDEGAFGGFQMAWRELADAGIDPRADLRELRYKGFPQDAIVLDVLHGKADAGTVRTDVLEGMAEQGRIDLAKIRVLNQQPGDEFPFMRSTRLYPEWAFAKVRTTPDPLARDVAVALLRMPADHPAARQGEYAGWTVPMNYQPVHELFRQLKIGPYAQLSRFTLSDAIQRYWYWFVLIMLVVLFSISFNILVKRQVVRRTAELTREVAIRQRAEEESRTLLNENRFLIGKSLAVQEEERHHLARELHDELGQCITAIQADASIINERAKSCDPRLLASAAAIQDVAARIYEVVHSMMLRLRPSMLDDLGIVDTLKEEVDAWRERQPGTDYELSFDGNLSDLGEDVNITLYRVAQECLTNIAKHGQATRVSIELGIRTEEGEGRRVELRIRDDGVGFGSRSRGKGLGLIGMRERVEGLGGLFHLSSAPGAGTAIAVELPLTEKPTEFS